MPLSSPSPAPRSLRLPDAGQFWKSPWVKARFATFATGTLLIFSLIFSGCQSVPDIRSIPREPGFIAPATAAAPATATAAPTPAPEPPPARTPPAATPPATRGAPETAVPPSETGAPETTGTPATGTPEAGPERSVPRLTIAPIPDDLPDYNRKDWKHWSDPDRDCQNTRAEVLIAESAAPVTFTRDKECTVATGRWLDPFTGTTFTEAGDLDVDHLVPLANAHRSGGWRWSAEQKERFANSMDYANHLIAVDKSANRAKGAKGPEGWQPPNPAYHCQYALDWIAIKDEWELTATAGEWDALEEMLERC